MGQLPKFNTENEDLNIALPWVSIFLFLLLRDKVWTPEKVLGKTKVPFDIYQFKVPFQPLYPLAFALLDR